MNTIIPSVLLEKELATVLGLAEEPYLILIPKSVLQHNGINLDEINFDLKILNGKILLKQR